MDRLEQLEKELRDLTEAEAERREVYNAQVKELSDEIKALKLAAYIAGLGVDIGIGSELLRTSEFAFEKLRHGWDRESIPAPGSRFKVVSIVPDQREFGVQLFDDDGNPSWGTCCSERVALDMRRAFLAWEEQS